MKNQPIFITGTTGLAGGFAIPELNQRNFNLRMMVRQTMEPISSHQNVYAQGDLTDLKQLNKISKNNAGIIHYACASLRGKAPIEVDMEAMKILLSNWDNGPFIFISSLDVYGAPATTDQVNENHPLSGRMNAYAAGKIECEKLLIQHAKQKGRTDYTIFRAPWIFAPSLASKNHMQKRFLDIFSDDIILPGETSSEWKKYMDPWVDARDLAWLVAEAVSRPLGGAGNVVTSLFNWHDFFMIINSITLSKRKIIHKSIGETPTFSAELFGQTAMYSGDKVNQFYAFTPRYTLQDTLREAFLM